MFKSNTANEIIYIFTWLFGIVLLYGLVHTFVLEPSMDKPLPIHQVKEVTPILKPLISDVLKTVSAEKIVQKMSSLDSIKTSIQTKVEKKDKVSLPISSVPIAIKAPRSIELNTTSNIVPTPTIPQQVDTEKIVQKASYLEPIATSAETKVEKKDRISLSVPSVPIAIKAPRPIEVNITTITVPTVIVIPTSNIVEDKKISQPSVKTMIKKVEETYDRDATMKVLETARQGIVNEVALAREKVMKSLNR